MTWGLGEEKRGSFVPMHSQTSHACRCAQSFQGALEALSRPAAGSSLVSSSLICESLPQTAFGRSNEVTLAK